MTTPRNNMYSLACFRYTRQRLLFKPTYPFKAMRSLYPVPSSFPFWILFRLDMIVLTSGDFVTIEDANSKRCGWYVYYDSLLDIDYDDYIDEMLDLQKMVDNWDE